MMHGDDRRDPVLTRQTQGTKDNLPEKPGHELSWKASKLEGFDENGKPFRGRFRLTQVVADCKAA
jgi:hypothetical protein